MMVPEILGEEGLLGLGLFCLALWMSIRTTRSAYRLAKEDPVQRGILATLAASFTFAFILSFKQGSLVGFSAEMFSFAILIERQARLLVSAERVQVGKETIEPQSKPVIVLKASPDVLLTLLSTPGVPPFGPAK